MPVGATEPAGAALLHAPDDLTRRLVIAAEADEHLVQNDVVQDLDARLCAEKIDYIDFKDVKLLQSFVPERGKIMPRRISGTCALHQRKLNEAIKRARNIALLPYTTA